jgi:serine/threonine-protein kinase
MRPSPGATIGGRYRLVSRAWDTPAGEAWEAHDTVLERTVFVQLFPLELRDRVAHGVTQAASVSHPGLCQIYDVTSEPPGIVFEHAPGGRLSERRDGALPPAHAAAIACRLADALAALHDRDVTHGSFGPDAVLFDEEGRAKIAGSGVADALGVPPPIGYRPREDATPEMRDRYGLAAVAYRLFTGREPGPDAPPARSVRRSVPQQVDALLASALAHDVASRPTLEQFRHTLAPIAAAQPVERGPGFFRQEARWLVPVLLLVGLGIAAMALGVQLGAIKIGGDGKGQATSTPATGLITVADVHDFDPEGNGEEHPTQTKNAIDRDDKTFWATLGYNGPRLDGRKKGVGLVFDLGSPRQVGRIQVSTPFPGWKAEWRVADRAGAAADDFRIVADFTAGGDAVPIPARPTGRYWLLWITAVVKTDIEEGHPYGAVVSEVQFFAN